jgi:hypothetical protein
VPPVSRFEFERYFWIFIFECFSLIACAELFLPQQSPPMVYTRRQHKRAAPRSSDIWTDATLEHVLSFVGAGQHAFVAQVSRDWMDCYVRTTISSTSTAAAHSTFYSAAFASQSRLRLALDVGLAISDSRVQHHAGRCAAAEVLTLANELGMPFSPEVLHGAAVSGCVSRVLWLCTVHNCALPDDITAYAAQSGSIDMLMWLRQRGCAFNQRTSYHAARAGDMAILEFLHAENCAFSAEACEAAATAGNLQLLQWLRDRDCPWHAATVVTRAASSGNVQMMSYLKDQQGVVFDAWTMRDAAMAGHLLVCQYLHAIDCSWSKYACSAAAHYGHCDTLRWLHEQNCPWDFNHICADAAAGGSVAVLQYLAEQCGSFTSEKLQEMLNAAGAYGKLDAAVWLRQQGAEWPSVLKFTWKVWEGDTLAWAEEQSYTAKIDAVYYFDIGEQL